MPAATPDPRPAPGLAGQALRFATVGVANTGLGYALIVALHLGAGFGLLAANAIGYGAGLALSYAANRAWTFDGAPSSARSRLLFLPLVAAGFAANLAVTSGLTRAGLPYPVAQALGIAAYSALVFMGMRHVLFAPRR
ncbi:MAG: GtrA family protein [Pseudomonadota bacterium]